MRAKLFFILGILSLLLGSTACAQTALGKHPQDTVITNFYGLNLGTNASKTLMGLVHANATAKSAFSTWLGFAVGSGQPASANLTNWAGVTTNQVLFDTEAALLYQLLDTQLSHWANVETNEFLTPGQWELVLNSKGFSTTLIPTAGSLFGSVSSLSQDSVVMTVGRPDGYLWHLGSNVFDGPLYKRSQTMSITNGWMTNNINAALQMGTQAVTIVNFSSSSSNVLGIAGIAPGASLVFHRDLEIVKFETNHITIFERSSLVTNEHQQIATGVGDVHITNKDATLLFRAVAIGGNLAWRFVNAGQFLIRSNFNGTFTGTASGSFSGSGVELTNVTGDNREWDFVVDFTKMPTGTWDPDTWVGPRGERLRTGAGTGGTPFTYAEVKSKLWITNDQWSQGANYLTTLSMNATTNFPAAIYLSITNPLAPGMAITEVEVISKISTNIQMNAQDGGAFNNNINLALKGNRLINDVNNINISDNVDWLHLNLLVGTSQFSFLTNTTSGMWLESPQPIWFNQKRGQIPGQEANAAWIPSPQYNNIVRMGFKFLNYQTLEVFASDTTWRYSTPRFTNQLLTLNAIGGGNVRGNTNTTWLEITGYPTNRFASMDVLVWRGRCRPLDSLPDGIMYGRNGSKTEDLTSHTNSGSWDFSAPVRMYDSASVQRGLAVGGLLQARYFPIVAGDLESGLLLSFPFLEMTGVTSTNAAFTNWYVSTANGGFTWTNGVTGGAVHFAGAGAMASPSEVFPLGGGQSNLTVSCFFRTTNNNGQQMLVAKWGGSPASQSFYLSTYFGTNIIAAVYNSNLNISVPTSTYNRSFTNDQWHHAAFTYDGLNMAIYVNGELYGKTAATGPGIINTNSQLLHIGVNAAGQFYTGDIDNVQIWNRTLSTNDIWSLYHAYIQKATVLPYTFAAVTVASGAPFTNITGRSTLHLPGHFTTAVATHPLLVVSNFTANMVWSNSSSLGAIDVVPFTFDYPAWSPGDIGAAWDLSGSGSAVNFSTGRWLLVQ